MSSTVAQQPPHRLRLVGLHQLEQRSPLGGGQLAEQVGRVVGGHGLQHVRGALPAQLPRISTWSSSGSSSRTSASRSSSSAAATSCAALRRQVVQRAGDVGGAHLLEHGEQVRRCPAGSVSVSPVTARQSTTASRRGAGQAAAAGRGPRAADHPVAGAGRLHRGVDDGDLLAGLADRHRRVEQLGRGPASRRAAARTGACSPSRWRADASGSTPVTRSIGTKIRRRVATSTTSPSTRGGLPSDPQRGDDVAHLADALTVRPEHGEAHHACDEDAGCAHPEASLVRSARDPRPAHRIRHPPVMIVRRTVAWGCTSTSSTSSPIAPYAGNPLAVVHRARTLTTAQMQAIAREFGLSETAFTLSPTHLARHLPAADLHPDPRAAVRRAPQHRRGLGAGVRRHDPHRGRRPGVRGGAAARARRPDGARRGGRYTGGRTGLDGAQLAAPSGSPRTTSTRTCPRASRRRVCRSRSWR